MTAEEFFAFTATRPDGEKWELIEGEPVLSPSANHVHQRILGNLIVALALRERERAVSWEAIPGIGVEVSKTSIPVPDVLVRPATLLDDWKCADMIVAFEVLSPSTADHDLRWKRRAYATLASLQHYVVVAQDAVEVVVYDRQTGFGERRIEGTKATLDLPALEIALPLAEIYRETGLVSS
jgi:Uma2 family endonuclease